MLGVKKRYIASVLGVLFLVVYGGLLLQGPPGRGGVRSLLAPATPARTAAQALAHWSSLARARQEQGEGAATRAALARMQRSLAAYTGTASPPLQQQAQPGAAAPAASGGGAALPALNAVLLAAPKLDEVDLWTTLSSIAAAAPDCVVLLLLNPEQAAALAPHVLAPGAPAAPPQPAAAPALDASAAQTSWRRGAAAGTAGHPRAPLRLWLRMYSWPALDARLPPAHRALLPPIRRYAMYPLMLDDMEGAGGAAGGDSSEVLFSNLDGARLRAPTGVLISDARDMVFQADPFPALWRHVGGASAQAAAATAIVVAGEANVMRLKQDDWNRGWVSFCYYDLGEAMVGEEDIYCSGTTFGTLAGMRHYLLQGMLPAIGYCAEINWEKGMDQGIHNVMTHMYSGQQLAGWRARADAGGPFREGGGKLPIMAQPKEFLGLVEEFQRGLQVHVAHAEEGDICTMALLLTKGIFRDASGRVLPGPGQPPCAIVHQFDRSPPLVEYYRGLYPL